MAFKARTTADSLKWLADLGEKPHEFGFYAVLRALECMHADKPRLGEAARPAEEAVRFGQVPTQVFAPSTLASFAAGDGTQPHRLTQFFFGLFGPHGPLPLHLTEYARDREQHFGDSTFRRFADLFHHRLTMLFYRARANTEPCVSLDRAEGRRFDTYVGSSIGLAPAALRRRDAAPDEAKLHLAGLFALPMRPAVGLRSILREFFRVPVRIEELVGEWLPLRSADRCRLGLSGTALGHDAILGAAVWSRQHKFRVVCGPLAYADFKNLLPNGTSVDRLRDLVLSYLGYELEWDLNLVLDADSVPALKLGESGELGWNTWLGQRRTTAPADEVITRPRPAHV
jgi:type VI secretion system protein ImpH